MHSLWPDMCKGNNYSLANSCFCLVAVEVKASHLRIIDGLCLTKYLNTKFSVLRSLLPELDEQVKISLRALLRRMGRSKLEKRVGFVRRFTWKITLFWNTVGGIRKLQSQGYKKDSKGHGKERLHKEEHGTKMEPRTSFGRREHPVLSVKERSSVD